MALRFAGRMDNLGTEGAFEVLAHAKRLEAQGRDIIHLEIGEPDYSTPANIIDAAVRAMRSGATHYTPASGIMEVREATARYVTKTTGAPCQAENIVLVPGTKNLVLFAIWSLINPGDEVIVPDPGYPAYKSLVEFLGGVAVPVPIRESNDFRLDVEDLRRCVTDRTRLLIVNSPTNPTGGVLTRSDCEAIAALANEHDLVVLSDEIYSRLIYDGEHTSLYGIDGMQDRTILVNGLSKAWAMCGWRLGFGAMPVELAKRMDRLMINTSSCAASFTQWAAVEAFESPESDRAVASMLEEFRRRRDLIVEGLNSIPGITCHKPAGAFYVFPNITGTGFDERTLASDLLDEVGVAVLAGTAFGAEGKGYIRLSYVNSQENLERAVERIRSYLGVAVSGRS